MNKLLIPFVALLTLTAAAQDRPEQDHHAQMTARGEEAMGFDQAATTHHFYLYENGGAIQVTVNDPGDRKNLAAIRAHLPHIAKMFSEGNFSLPHFIHADAVPGSEGMKRLRDRISYVYEEIPSGGRVRIATRHARALAAVHEFLRFQITDHKTGDSLQISREP